MMESTTPESAMEPTTGDSLDGLAPEVLARVRRSLVDVYVKRAKGGDDLHTLGVVGAPSGVIAWSGVDAAEGWENPGGISIRQGSQAWRAEMDTLNVKWALCRLSVEGDFPLPVVPWRRSNTFAMGERLSYAVADPQGGEPKLGWVELIDVYAEKEAFERAFIWTARLDPTLPRGYAVAFDHEGRVAGLLEPLPNTPVAALLAGEWVGCLAERCWVEMLSEVCVSQLIREYREAPDSYEAETQCRVGRGLLGLGDRDGAMQAYGRAVAKDPLNPWPQRALASLLLPDQIDEARALLQRAVELEAREPEGAHPDPNEPTPRIS